MVKIQNDLKKKYQSLDASYMHAHELTKTQQARIYDLESKLKKMEAEKTKEDESKWVNQVYNNYTSSVWSSFVPKW